jgi:hypothetical protein
MRAITTSASLGKDDSSLASTRAALDLVEEYSFLKRSASARCVRDPCSW